MRIKYGFFALCFGYFATYIPLSMMTKMITKGLFDGMNGVGISGFEIQPMTSLATLVTMLSFITFAGWWKHTTRFSFLGLRIPRPQWFTFVSGICTAIQIITTILAYTFQGISIVFAMLLMRGGVLVMAPVIDTIARRRRHIYWPSWIAALFSMGALLVAFAGKAGTAMTTIATVNILLYLFGYFFRLLFMSNRAKTDDPIERRRYFAEEAATANILLVLSLIVVGLIGSTMSPESLPGLIWKGFIVVPSSGHLTEIFLIGFFSAGAGIFGPLIYLDKRENTFTVPANRSSSMIAGVVSSYLLAFLFGQRQPSIHELIGVALVIGAIFFLAYRSAVEKKIQTASH